MRMKSFTLLVAFTCIIESYNRQQVGVGSISVTEDHKRLCYSIDKKNALSYGEKGNSDNGARQEWSKYKQKEHHIELGLEARVRDKGNSSATATADLIISEYEEAKDSTRVKRCLQKLEPFIGNFEGHRSNKRKRSAKYEGKHRRRQRKTKPKDYDTTDEGNENEEDINEELEKKRKRRRKKKRRKKRRHWGKWTEWSPCSVTCGKGRKIRWRKCIAKVCSTGELEMGEKTCQLPACSLLDKFFSLF